jgi:hypothetical protein
MSRARDARAARQQQVRHVDTTDQEHEACRGEQNEQRAFQTSHELFAPHEEVGRAHGIGELLRETHRDSAEICLRRIRRDSRLENRHDGDHVLAMVLDVGNRARIQHDDDIDAAAPVEVEAVRQDADDRSHRAAGANLSTDDRGVAGKLPLPESVRENDLVVRLGRRLSAAIHPAEGGVVPDHVEEVARHAQRGETERGVIGDERERRECVRGHRAEAARLRAPLEIVGVRNGEPRIRRRDVVRVELRDAVAVAVRQRAQQRRVDDAEDCRVRADREAEGENDDQRKCRKSTRDAQRVSRVLHERVPAAAAAHVAKLFRVPVYAAEPPAGFSARGVGSKAGVAELLGFHLEMETQLVGDVCVGISSEHAVDESHRSSRVS